MAAPTLPSHRRAALPALWCLLAALALPASAQSQDDAFAQAVTLQNSYGMEANITYMTASGRDLKLDLYRQRYAKGDTPVLLKIHGGGWVLGNREGESPTVLPYLQMGFAVVNIEYRLARTALAPAAVEDALCALQWIGRNAKRYKFDLSKVVVSGASAGGHLALTTAMIPGDSAFANQCASTEPTWSGPYSNPAPTVAAVVNWFGITDVADMLQGPNTRSYAVSWFGSMPERVELARRLSPLSYVRAGAPPVLTIHGDADPLVPYAHGVRLHQALSKAGVKNQLLTIPGGGHGGFTLEQDMLAYKTIRSFLREQGIVAPQ